MILVSFFFSHRSLSIGIGRDGIELKVTEIAQTDKQTDTHSAFNVLAYILQTLHVIFPILIFVCIFHDMK